MITIRVKVVSLGSVVDVELPGESTILDARESARVDPSLEVRYQGRVVSESAQGETVLSDGDTLVFTSPSLKHG